MPLPHAVEGAVHASGPTLTAALGIGRYSLEVQPLATDTITYAQQIVGDWRATGLEVGLIEYFSPERGIDGYALTARGPDEALCCVCRCWRTAARFRHNPFVWTIEVLVSGIGRAEEGSVGREPTRRSGLAVAATHEEAWRQVQDWRQGKLLLQRDISTVPVGTLPTSSRPTFVPPRKVAGLVAITAAFGIIVYAGYGALEQLSALAWPPTKWTTEADPDLSPARAPLPRPDSEVRTGN